MTQEPSDEQVERAALHALDALDGAERQSYERLLADEGAEARAARSDVASFQRTAAQLGSVIPPVPPPSTLKARLMARIHAEPQASPSSSAAFRVIRASEGEWIEPRPGMKLKILYIDPGSQRTTAIARFAPGYHQPPHRHVEAEELFVLEGGCVCQGQTLLPGDYHRSDADSIHGETYTEDGCTLLMTFSPRNEPVGGLSAHVSAWTVSFLFRLSAFLSRLADLFSRQR